MFLDNLFSPLQQTKVTMSKNERSFVHVISLQTLEMTLFIILHKNIKTIYLAGKTVCINRFKMLVVLNNSRSS